MDLNKFKVNWNAEFEKHLSIYLGRNFNQISKKKLREVFFSGPSELGSDNLLYLFSQLGFSIRCVSAFKFKDQINEVGNLILDSDGNLGTIFKKSSKITIHFMNRVQEHDLENVAELKDYTCIQVVKEFEEEKSIKQRLKYLNFFKSVGGPKFFAIAVASTFSNILGLVSSIYIMVVYDRVLPNQAEHSLYALSIGVGVAVLFDIALKFIRSTFIEIANTSSQNNVTDELFEQYVEHVNVSNSKSTSALASISRDYDNYREFISSATITALIDFPFIFVFIAVMYYISGPLFLVPLIAVPILLLAIVLSQPMLLSLSRKLSSANQSKQSNLLEILGGLDEIRVNGGYSVMKRRFVTGSITQAELAARSKKISEFNGNLIATTQQLAQVAIIVYGYHLFVKNEITMGAIIASVIISGKTLQPLAKIAQTLSKTNGAITAYHNVKEFLSLPRFRKASDTNAMVAEGRPLLEFSNVTFRYSENSAPIFQDLSLVIRNGEKVAILGRNGAGKSTLIKLAAGILRAETGNILVSGVSVNGIERAEAKSQFALVNQNPWIFSGTLRDNITMGHDVYSDDEILRALVSSGLPDSGGVEGLLDLKINDYGSNLSGGQKQTLSIARVLLNRPKVILFDEPTSALDKQTEKTFLTNFSQDYQTTAAIFVTHKPDVVMSCSRVIVLESGKIVWDGSRESYFAMIKKRQQNAKV
ncbi:peptidase domain-containing ABC transporter [Ascidiaceihabitans sp.]|nr:peptidase domain-containing ABC transporter [Ascidiaceihabitans sp.]